MTQALNRFGADYTPEQVVVAADCVEAYLADGAIPLDMQMRAEEAGLNPQELEGFADAYAELGEDDSEDD